ncbi:MAG: Plug domain-containing protein, partial [Bacteroidales bacterium]|nr:Plug domain-containing protein [Bacteroidales bacterium]
MLQILSGNPSDTIVDIGLVTVSASIKNLGETDELALASSSFNLKEIESKNLNSVKDASISVPNFYQPKYGSHITSSIYIRGFGSRIDQPAMGLVIDNVPIMNKNAFDFDFLDIRRISVLRGPQGTLYGRNSNVGVMDIHTISPLAWPGTKI